MPVYDTGALLLHSVRSVLHQTFLAARGEDAIELLIVDDGSTDPATRAALAAACALSPTVRVLANRRAKGAAGARNTGIFEARATWVGFLDSDDLFYPDFLERQSRAIEAAGDVAWAAAHFHVGDEHVRPLVHPLAKRSPSLYRRIRDEYERGQTSRLRRPVQALLDCGCIGIFTARVRRDELLAVGGFDETLQSAEDHDLWLRLAVRHDLHLVPIDAGVYRVRKGSLTQSGRPMYWMKDRMLRQARSDPRFRRHAGAIQQRQRSVYDTYCDHFRRQRDFDSARRYALQLLRLAPWSSRGWRQLIAGMIRAA